MEEQKIKNPFNKNGIPILLDKERRLIINFNTLVHLEEEYGNLSDALTIMATTPTLKDVRKLLYFMLKEEDPSLTEEKVGQMIDINNLDRIYTAFGDAMENYIAADSEEGDNEDREKN